MIKRWILKQRIKKNEVDKAVKTLEKHSNWRTSVLKELPSNTLVNKKDIRNNLISILADFSKDWENIDNRVQELLKEEHNELINTIEKDLQKIKESFRSHVIDLIRLKDYPSELNDVVLEDYFSNEELEKIYSDLISEVAKKCSF